MFGSRKRTKFKDLAPGQRFRAAGGGLWEYVGIAGTKAPEVHAHLVRPGDSRTIKIVSMDALFDRSLFEQIP